VRPWTQIRPAEIVGHEPALLTATAWRYYLPAMITWCVREPDALDVLPDYLVWQLEPPEPEKSDEWFKERASGFTPAQRGVIVEYLEWYREREEAEYSGFQMEPPPHVYRALEYWMRDA
jgi:hypothetical protein